MKIVSLFVQRPIMTLMLFSVGALLGIMAFFRMPVELMPNADHGMLTIFIGVRGGLSPADIENSIVKIVEDEMATLNGLERISSVSKKDKAVITLNFKIGTNSADAALEVQERMAKIRGKLPKDIEKPVVGRYDENSTPIMIIALSSKELNPEEMRSIADNQLKPIVKRIAGVGNVEIGGGRERKILIEFDQSRLEAYSLPIRQIISQIGLENINLLTGKIDSGSESQYVRTIGAYQSIENIKDLPIAVTKEGSRIRLKDVSEIRDFYMEAESYSRMNNDPVVSAYIQKDADANTIKTAANIRTLLESFKTTVDPRVKLEIVSDHSVTIEESLQNVRQSLLIGALLAGIILIIFLKDVLSAVIIFISIPLTLVLTLMVMYGLGLGLNVMTLSGLAIATGMIVDNAIVVLENILEHRQRYLYRGAAYFEQMQNSYGDQIEESFWQKGSENRLLAIIGGGQIILALVASTLTTVIVFLPIVFLNPHVRQTYSDLAYTITSALLLSLIVAVSVVPCISGNLPQWVYREGAFFSSFINSGMSKSWNFFVRFSLKYWNIVKIFFKKNWRKITNQKKVKLQDEDWVLGSQGKTYLSGSGWYRFYRKIVVFLMRRRWWSVLVVGVLLALSMVLYRFLDKEFMGAAEQNEFTIFVELPSGTRLDISDKVVSSVERILNDTPEVQDSVKNTISRVEGWSSKIYVTLVPQVKRTRTAQDVIRDLRPGLSKVGQEYDAFIYFSEPSSAKELNINVYGNNYETLRNLAVQVAQVMQTVPGFTDVKLRYKPGRPEVELKVDKDRSSLLSLTVKDIAESLHAKVRGLRATYFLTENSQVEIVARVQEQYRKTLEDVENLSFINRYGNIVPLKEVVSVDYGLTPSEIYRQGRSRMIQVSATRDNISLSRAGEVLKFLLQQLPVPAGYYWELGGDYQNLLETEYQSKIAFLLMVLLVYMVLASLFESYRQPILIITVVPLTLIGAIPLLKFTKTPVTMGSLIGFIMLGGIAVNNSIMLFDVFNLIREKRGVYYSLILSGKERLRPILMTTLTTVLGMLPMVLSKAQSGSLWAPMALTVMGGLTVSTFMILFLFPAFFLVLEDCFAVFSSPIVSWQKFLAWRKLKKIRKQASSPDLV